MGISGRLGIVDPDAANDTALRVRPTVYENQYSTRSMNDRLRLTVDGMLFALGIGWVLYVGKSILVPIVFGVLVAYVIVGLTQLLFRLPFVGRFLPRHIAYTLAALVIAVVVATIVSLVATSMAGIVALAPQYEG